MMSDEFPGMMMLYDCLIEDETGLQTAATLSSNEILDLVAARMNGGFYLKRKPHAARVKAHILLRPLGTRGEWEEDDWSISWRAR